MPVTCTRPPARARPRGSARRARSNARRVEALAQRASSSSATSKRRERRRAAAAERGAGARGFATHARQRPAVVELEHARARAPRGSSGNAPSCSTHAAPQALREPAGVLPAEPAASATSRPPRKASPAPVVSTRAARGSAGTRSATPVGRDRAARVAVRHHDRLVAEARAQGRASASASAPAARHELARGALRGLEQIRARAQHALRASPRRRGPGTASRRRHVEVDTVGTPASRAIASASSAAASGSCDTSVVTRARARIELRVVRAHVLGRGLGGRARRHVDRALAARRRRRSRRTSSRCRRARCGARCRAGPSRRAGSGRPSSSACLPKMPRAQAERRGPAEVVQHDAADSAHRRAAGRDGAQDPLLVGAEHARHAVDAVDDHAADADDVESFCGARAHAAPRARGCASVAGPSSSRASRAHAVERGVEALRRARRASAGVPRRDRVARDHAESQQRALEARDRALAARRARARRGTPRARARTCVHALAVAGAAHLPGARPFARQRVRRPGDDADRQPAAQPPAAPVLGERAEPARARAEHLEDQHRVADVDPELAALAEAGGRARVVAEHLPRRATP